MPHSGLVEYTVVVPVYCEAESIVELADRVGQTFAAIGKSNAVEILYVDDGSTDTTPDVLAELSACREAVRYVRLRRNCGKSLALMAGFRAARGEIVITMDGDLQDNPEDIPALLAKLDEGYDVVSGWRVRRQDQSLRKLGSRLYNNTVRRATGLDLHDMNCGFKAYRRRAIEVLCVYGQYHRYIPLQAHLAGFRVGETPVGNSERKYGASKFPTFRYQGLFDLLSMLFTHKYALSPLHFFGVASVLVLVPSTLMLAWFVLQQVLFWAGFGEEHLVANRPLLGFALTAFLLGVFIFFTGFVCDFILHHLIRSRIDNVLGLVTETSGEHPTDAATAQDLAKVDV